MWKEQNDIKRGAIMSNDFWELFWKQLKELYEKEDGRDYESL
jgi:hypothetical protein